MSSQKKSVRLFHQSGDLSFDQQMGAQYKWNRQFQMFHLLISQFSVNCFNIFENFILFMTKNFFFSK